MEKDNISEDVKFPCPKCGHELRMEYVKINDRGGGDFELGVDYYCLNCDYTDLIY